MATKLYRDAATVAAMAESVKKAAAEVHDYNSMVMTRWPDRFENGVDEIFISKELDTRLMEFSYQNLYDKSKAVFTDGSRRHGIYAPKRPVICNPVEMWACINQWRGLWMSPTAFPIFSIAVTPLGDIVTELGEPLPARVRSKVITKRELIKLLDYHHEWDEWTHKARHLYNWDSAS